IGVHATIRPGAFNTKSTVPIYRIDLQQTGRNLERFATQVPARGRKADRLRLMLEDRPVHETSPGMYALPMELSRHLRDLDVGWKDQHKRMRRSTARSWAARTGDELLSIYAESDLLWERIRSIYADGLEEVFDLRVPASGNFVANGFVVHNSGALEADADLVMFLWQKDRKDRDENVVRLKLAKHRNGPTGDFDLHFQSELTRFRDLGETRQDV
ncbi:MAG TPA: DnaB-like helicase C-terminal domain-containing protein, partial [Verrucomicrobiae bacterium]|nr:DnaB-like helicase C-terminal domain-containing protein [Verrucomicrobiae bacterium]